VDFTWITIIATLCMGIGAALVFVFAVKKDYFHLRGDSKVGFGARRGALAIVDIPQSPASPRSSGARRLPEVDIIVLRINNLATS